MANGVWHTSTGSTAGAREQSGGVGVVDGVLRGRTPARTVAQRGRERARGVRERARVGKEEGKSRRFIERERERRGRRGKRKRWPAMASRPLMGGSNGEGRNGCVKAP
jgi:hypothetical protein